jgi:hypothetical protein
MSGPIVVVVVNVVIIVVIVVVVVVVVVVIVVIVVTTTINITITSFIHSPSHDQTTKRLRQPQTATRHVPRPKVTGHAPRRPDGGAVDFLGVIESLVDVRETRLLAPPSHTAIPPPPGPGWHSLYRLLHPSIEFPGGNSPALLLAIECVRTARQAWGGSGGGGVVVVVVVGTDGQRDWAP